MELFRNTPLLIQLFFWNFALPYAFPEEIRFKLFEMDFEFWVSTLGCGIFTGAFMAEIIRAGIQSIPKGLLEASYSSGLTFPQTLRKIILPLAFREIIPPLGSEFLNNMKNTSLAMTIGVGELCWSMQEVLSLTYRTFEAFIVATVIYLALSLFIAALLNTVNEKLKIMPADKITRLRRVAGRPLCPVRPAGLRAGARPLALPQAARSQDGLPPCAGWCRTSAKGIVLAAKIVFVAVIAYVLFITAKAIASFNFEIIRANLSTLLIWRFPNGEESEFFLGLGGLSASILMAVISITGSFFIGLLIGMGRTARNRAVRIPCTAYIELVRGVPLILVIFWFYQVILDFVFKVEIHAFWAGTIALTFFLRRLHRRDRARRHREHPARPGGGGQGVRPVLFPDHAQDRPAPGAQADAARPGRHVHRRLQGHLAGVHHRRHGPDPRGLRHQQPPHGLPL